MGIEIEDGMGFRGLLPSREDAMEERIWKQKKELARLRAEVERLKNFVSQIESICLYSDEGAPFVASVRAAYDDIKDSEEE